MMLQGLAALGLGRAGYKKIARDNSKAVKPRTGAPHSCLPCTIATQVTVGPGPVRSSFVIVVFLDRVSV